MAAERYGFVAAASTHFVTRVERWFGGTVLIGLGVAAAIVAPRRSN